MLVEFSYIKTKLMVCFSIRLEQQSGLIFFFSRMHFVSRVSCKEYHDKMSYTECVGLVNLVDSLDHIYNKMPKTVT